MLCFVADVAQFFPCCTPKKPCLALFSFPLRNMQSGLLRTQLSLIKEKKSELDFPKSLTLSRFPL